MRFIHNNLGNREKGEVVEITLTDGANVRVMNSANFSNYKYGRRYQYIGGLAKCSPVRLQIPEAGHWHVVVDMQGLIGNTSASVCVLTDSSNEIQDLKTKTPGQDSLDIKGNKQIKQSISIGL